MELGELPTREQTVKQFDSIIEMLKKTFIDCAKTQDDKHPERPKLLECDGKTLTEHGCKVVTRALRF